MGGLKFSLRRRCKKGGSRGQVGCASLGPIVTLGVLRPAPVPPQNMLAKYPIAGACPKACNPKGCQDVLAQLGSGAAAGLQHKRHQLMPLQGACSAAGRPSV